MKDNQNNNNNNEESKKRWEFIEKVSKEVDDWPDWKKVEAFPTKVQTTKESCLTGRYGPEKVEFK